MYGVAALFFMIVGGIEATLIRIQLAVPNNNFVSADFYNQLFTVHALTMIFAALMPLTAAFFNFVMPLQIGARDVAFPRLNALSYWVYLFGVIFFNAGIFMKQGPTSAGSRTRPSPRASSRRAEHGLLRPGRRSWLFVHPASLNFMRDDHNMRAPGMRSCACDLHRMTLITAILIVTAMAVVHPRRDGAHVRPVLARRF